jgi:hypothetical protein
LHEFPRIGPNAADRIRRYQYTHSEPLGCQSIRSELRSRFLRVVHRTL